MSPALSSSRRIFQMINPFQPGCLSGKMQRLLQSSQGWRKGLASKCHFPSHHRGVERSQLREGAAQSPRPVTMAPQFNIRKMRFSKLVHSVEL